MELNTVEETRENEAKISYAQKLNEQTMSRERKTASNQKWGKHEEWNMRKKKDDEVDMSFSFLYARVFHFQHHFECYSAQKIYHNRSR